MQYYPFDSRNKLYREKFGALAEGEALRLRLLLHNDARVHEAFLILRKDEWDNPWHIKLEPKEWLEDYRFYDTEINLEEGLYWYSFRYTSDYGEFYVTKTETSLGIVSREGASWQQTVYNKDFKTPDWLDGGIIYQIFPDRFYNSGKEKHNVPEDRYLVEDWAKQPEFRQPNDKCRLGNDYYGGDLLGIEQKLDYLEELGVSCIYLNPIFEAHSNHRYNTADYMKIDSLLGDEKDLESLIKKAKKKGISIVLDGVFSHTGDDSIYFNAKGRYDSLGAAQSQDSPYFKWFSFSEYPYRYAAWWGIKTLPETNENSPEFTEFIAGENGVIRHWLKKGIMGWRLDVADELPDEFLDNIRKAVKAEGKDKYLLGEVWEDATNKISYGYRRRFLRGKQLDSVMNYPFANAIVDFLKGAHGSRIMNTVLDILENYPPEAVKTLMNHIGTHDTPRILTRLGADNMLDGNREAQSHSFLNDWQYDRAVKLLKLASVLQFALPGVPSIYYGDEAGMQGFGDPFCRAGYPWGNENKELLEFYKALGKARRNCKAFVSGSFVPVYSDNNLVCFIRENEKAKAFIAVNRSEETREIELPNEFLNAKILIGDGIENGKLKLSPFGFSVLAV